MGSLARLRNRHTFSIEPFSSKSCLKNLAVSILTWRRNRREEEEEGREGSKKKKNRKIVMKRKSGNKGNGGREGGGIRRKRINIISKQTSTQRDTYTHGSKHNGKVVFMVITNTLCLTQFHQTTLPTDLSCNLKEQQNKLTMLGNNYFKT